MPEMRLREVGEAVHMNHNWKDAIIGTLALFGFAAAIVWVAG